MLEVALRGLLPPIVLVLLTSFDRRWFALATGAAFAVVLLLLGPDGLQLPPALWQGGNDATQWFAWCVVAAGLIGTLEALRLLPRPLGLGLALLLVPISLWLPLQNLRGRWSLGDEVLFSGLGGLLLLASVVTFRALPAKRPGLLLPVFFTLCLSIDALALLLGARSALQAQLAGALAAALGATIGATLWRRPFVLPPATTLPLALGHAGLLLLGYHLNHAPDLWLLVAAALAPFAFWLRELPALRARPGQALLLSLLAGATLLGFAAGRAASLAVEQAASGY